MKYFLLTILLTFNTIYLNAQVTGFPDINLNQQVEEKVDTSFETKINNIYKGLDLDEVQSGILLDRTFSTINLKPYVQDTLLSAKPELPNNWRHLYNVFLRNARNEADKWSPQVMGALLTQIDSLMMATGIPDPDQVGNNKPAGCDGIKTVGDNWFTRYAQLKEAALKESENHPPATVSRTPVFKAY